jgi:hypothetical protein
VVFEKKSSFTIEAVAVATTSTHDAAVTTVAIKRRESSFNVISRPKCSISNAEPLATTKDVRSSLVSCLTLE